jgi:hypothetical protein
MGKEHDKQAVKLRTPRRGRDAVLRANLSRIERDPTSSKRALCRDASQEKPW